MNPTGVEITAGLGGFLVLFGLGLALWFLGRDLTRRLRRSRQREELRSGPAEGGGGAASGATGDGAAGDGHSREDDPHEPGAGDGSAVEPGDAGGSDPGGDRD